jgi:DNA-binding transcriptional ArsR family regulator
MNDMDAIVFQALSDPHRLAIVDVLADGGELCVCEVSAELGISNALASHHIKKLREAGLVTTRRKGTWLHCRLEARTVMRLAHAFHELAARGVTVSGSTTVSAGCCASSASEASDE